MTIYLHQLIDAAIRQAASDIHLSAGLPPMIRIDGEMVKVGTNTLNHHDISCLLNEILDETQKNALQHHDEHDFIIDYHQSARLRIHIFQQTRGIAAAFRILPQKVLSLDELMLPKSLKKIACFSSGLVLVTGPTGSGKTTTLAALIDHINHTQALHILTIEDPIEYIQHSKRCLINQRQINKGCNHFSDILRSALRADPDIIVIGELRDLETIRLALTAAETGHLVLSTLHTTTTVSTIERIIDVFPSEEKNLIRTICASVLCAVISQKLVKKAPSGRIALVEIMTTTLAIQNLIRENKLHQIYSNIQTGQNLGMQTFEMHQRQLIADGIRSLPQ